MFVYHSPYIAVVLTVTFFSHEFYNKCNIYMQIDMLQQIIFDSGELICPGGMVSPLLILKPTLEFCRGLKLQLVIHKKLTQTITKKVQHGATLFLFSYKHLAPELISISHKFQCYIEKHTIRLFIQCVRKIFQKTNICRLIRTRTYQGRSQILYSALHFYFK